MTDKEIRVSRYTAGQVSRMAGVPASRLNGWARIKLLMPSVAAADGSKTCRVYSFSDCVAARVAHLLRELGLETVSLRVAVLRCQLVDYGKMAEGLNYLIIHRCGSEFLPPGESPSKWPTPMVVLELSAIVAEMRVAASQVVAPKRGKAVNVFREPA